MEKHTPNLATVSWEEFKTMCRENPISYEGRKNDTFAISKAGRRNLKAICRDFDRASRQFGGLFHLRMMPWDDWGTCDISRQQWAAFREAEQEHVDHEVWWQWDLPRWDSDYLGQWFGDPDGLEEFKLLSESVAMVLSRENFVIDEFFFDCTLDSGPSWIHRLHDWSFWYQMPLLRVEQDLWGAENCAFDEFFELRKMWDTVEDGTLIPRHPMVWRLVDNVFTSSMTAIRAMLWPDDVIATNEPWPVVDGVVITDFVGHSPVDTESPAIDEKPTSELVEYRNSMNFDGSCWRVRYSQDWDGKSQVFFPSEGMKRISMLLKKPYQFFEYEELNHTPKTVQLEGSSETPDGEASGTHHQDGIDVNDKGDDKLNQDINKRLKELTELLRSCKEKGDSDGAAEHEEEIEELKKCRRQYFNQKGKSRKDPNDWERARSAVRNSLDRAIKKMKKQSPNLSAHLKEYIKYDRGVIYDPPVTEELWDIRFKGHK